jgi:hypothetical protein
MRRFYKSCVLTMVILESFFLVAPVVARGIDLLDSIPSKTALKFKDNRPNRPVFKTNIPSDFDSFMSKMNGLTTTKNPISAKPNQTKTISNVALEPVKPIDNVKIYPNPVAEQLTLSYTLKKESMVTIKILDVLGNEVKTLLSKKVSAGEQSNTFILENKLNSGFYFVRLIAGSDSIIKRISVL